MADYMSSQRRPSDPLLQMPAIMEETSARGNAAARRRRSTAMAETGMDDGRDLQQRLASAEMINEQLRLQLGRAEADLALSGRTSLEATNRAVGYEETRRHSCVPSI